MNAQIELLAWLLISLLLGIVAVNVIYRREGGRWLLMAEESTLWALAREAGYFMLMVGIPFIALITGAVGVDLMALGGDLATPGRIFGFTFADWVRGTGVAAAAVLSVLAVLWFGARTAPQAEHWHIGPLALRDAFYNEVHWTFYRAAPALFLGDPYWGVLIGGLLVMIEWAAHPDASEGLKSIEGRQYMILRLACLFCSGFLYLATHNLWLMIVANLVIQLAGSRVLGAQRVEGQAEEIGD